MSYAIRCTIICDGCGQYFFGPQEKRSTYANMAVPRALEAAKGWIKLSQGYRTEKHFCPECADKPVLKSKILT